jgi:hypothetical protein
VEGKKFMKSQDENPQGSTHHAGERPAPPRKAYTPPTLVVYGDLTVLTASGGNDAPADSGFGSRRTT